MSNRAARRAQAKREQKLAQLYKNGITQQDIDEAYQQGFRKGYHDRAFQIIRAYYGATILTLHQEFKFGQERCIRALRGIETNLVNCLTEQELIEQAEKELDIKICLDEAIDRAQPM